MSFLQLQNKRFLIFGVANKKSVAYQIATMLLNENAVVDLVVRDETIAEKVRPLFPGQKVFVCNVENELEIVRLRLNIEGERNGLSDAVSHTEAQRHRENDTNVSPCASVPPCGTTNSGLYDGLVHSIAFADYGEGMKPFHETPKEAFLQALDISCFSLIAICRELAGLLTRTASVVTISISTTRMASENYGFMAPIKAALDSSLTFLTKSFNQFSEIRFNAVAPSLLKTSASAGIPGYADSYLFAEKVIPRGRAVQTEEAAAAAVFLLSPRSSGIVAQKIVVDAGMEINYFDKELVQKVVR
jgi:enoyl-[acyl-carrier protein] reductase I